jgi:phosphoglycolate phosphatase
MKFKGIIFDLDGTLVDSIEDIADSMNFVLSNYNFPEHNINEYKYLVGKGIRNLVINSLPEHERKQQTIDACYEMMTEKYNLNCLNKTNPYKGIVELLEQLKNRKIVMSVFSNKNDDFTKKVVNELIPGYFEIVEGIKNEELKKPNPFIAIQIAEKLNIFPEEMIYVGDTNTDMQTANNAGMFAVGALWGFRTKQELIDSGAKFIAQKPEDILKLI